MNNSSEEEDAYKNKDNENSKQNALSRRKGFTVSVPSGLEVKRSGSTELRTSNTVSRSYESALYLTNDSKRVEKIMQMIRKYKELHTTGDITSPSRLSSENSFQNSIPKSKESAKEALLALSNKDLSIATRNASTEDASSQRRIKMDNSKEPSIVAEELFKESAQGFSREKVALIIGKAYKIYL
jgi:hypothetical protein